MSGPGRLCSASDKARKSVSGSDSAVGLRLARNRLKRFNGCFIFGIGKGFSIPPHDKCSRYEAAFTSSKEGATELSEISSKIFLLNTESDTADDFTLANSDWEAFMQCSQMVVKDGMNG